MLRAVFSLLFVGGIVAGVAAIANFGILEDKCEVFAAGSSKTDWTENFEDDRVSCRDS